MRKEPTFEPIPGPDRKPSPVYGRFTVATQADDDADEQSHGHFSTLADAMQQAQKLSDELGSTQHVYIYQLGTFRRGNGKKLITDDVLIWWNEKAAIDWDDDPPKAQGFGYSYTPSGREYSVTFTPVSPIEEPTIDEDPANSVGFKSPWLPMATPVRELEEFPETHGTIECEDCGKWVSKAYAKKYEREEVAGSSRTRSMFSSGSTRLLSSGQYSTTRRSGSSGSRTTRTRVKSVWLCPDCFASQQEADLFMLKLKVAGIIAMGIVFLIFTFAHR